jgi:penicillin-binding protein-related factor A (putative recombinase)
MATAGTRGKWSEKEVKKWMDKRSDAEAAYWAYRYPDARAGSFQVTPADFGVLHNGHASLVEVKEVAHAFRLPAKNFSDDKRARMKKFAMAGGEGWVIVCHMPEKVWRVAPIEFFVSGVPSWDLSALPTFPKVKDVMEYIFGLPGVVP